MTAIEPTSVAMAVMAARRAELAAAVMARVMRMNADAGRDMAALVAEAADQVADLVTAGPPRGMAALVDVWA